MSTDVDMSTSREAVLEAEVARLRRLLADAGVRANEAAASASVSATEQRVLLAKSRQETRDAREDTRQANQAASDAASEHRSELAVHHAETTRQAGRYAALHTSEGRLRLILESAKDFAIFTTDLDGRVNEWNTGARNVLGWTEGEMLGQDLRMIWTPEDQDAGIPEQEMRLARDEGRATNERWHLRRDGSRFWAVGEMLPLQDETGRLVGYLKMLHDRTEQHLAGEALRAGEARFRTILDTIQAAFAIVEVKFDADDRPVDYRFLEANPAFERQAGVDLRGKWVTEFAPDLEQFWFDTYGHVAKTGEPASFENYAKAFERWFEVLAVRIGDPAERQIAIFFTDTTARRALEADRDRVTADLRALTETLEQRVGERTTELMSAEAALRQSQKMEAVGQLTGGIAHDFNNLLAGIMGALDLMSTRITQGRYTDVERYVGAAQGAAQRAAALTHRLLAFSRRQTLDPKPTDVNGLVNGMEDLIRRTVGPAIELGIIGVEDLWSTLVDPPQLESALLNLCINARDAMPDGGRLTVEAANRTVDARMAVLYELTAGQYVTLCVSDTGTGMPPDVIAKAFDPFFTTKPIGQGTGLGLSMIYGFVRQSGGQVRIHSELGQGTTVCLYLPRHVGQAEAAEAVLALTDAPRSGRGETVLVVDDEPVVRMLITEVLEELGYVAVEAADGASGLKVLQSDMRIDLLVTDVGLPGGMNGRQVADAARVNRPDLKVLFITGYAENAVLSHGHLEPGMYVLIKPFAMEVLANRIRDVILA